MTAHPDLERSAYTGHPAIGLRQLDDAASPITASGGLPIAWLKTRREVRQSNVREFFDVLLQILVARHELSVEAVLRVNGDRASQLVRRRREVVSCELTHDVIKQLTAGRPERVIIELRGVPIFECAAGWLNLTMWLTGDEEAELGAALASCTRRARNDMTAHRPRGTDAFRALLVRSWSVVSTVVAAFVGIVVGRAAATGVVSYLVGFVVIFVALRLASRLRAEFDIRL